MTHVSAPVIPGAMTPENATKALCQMCVPLVWLVWT